MVYIRYASYRQAIQVFIPKNEKTGGVILSRRPSSWDEFFKLRDEAIKADPCAAEEFLANRNDLPPEN